MYDQHQPSPRKASPTAPSCRLPQVADTAAPQQSCEPTEGPSSELTPSDLSTFKVFMKRNLRNQAPPADLLASIRAGIEAVR